MKTNKIALFSCAALVAAGIGLNIQNAIADYGIGENSFSLVAVGGSNSGSNSNSNSNSNWNSNTDTLPDISDSDTDGNNDATRTWELKGEDCPISFTGYPANTTISYSVHGYTGTCKIGADGTGKTKLTDYAEYCKVRGNLSNCTQMMETPCPTEDEIDVD